MKDLLVSPMIYLLLVLSLCILLNAYKLYKKQFNYVVLPLIVILYLLSTPLGSNILMGYINYPNDRMNCVSNIGVLLPGGLDHIPNHAADYMSMSSETLRRVHGTVDWITTSPVIRTLIVSGDGENSRYSEARLVSNYLSNFLGDSQSIEIKYDEKSETTHHSAINTAKLLQQREIVLFTSALHMTRAKLTFERIGFKVCPAVTHTNHIDKINASSFMPDAYSDLKSKAVLHELIGLLWYRVTNRI